MSEKSLENFNLIAAIDNQETDAIKNFIEHVVNKIIFLIRKHEFDKLQTVYEKLKPKCLRATKKLSCEKSIDFCIGYFLGNLEILSEFVLDNAKKRTIEDVIGVTKIEDIPHVNDIIINIEKSSGIRHGKLAEKVGIEKNTLSKIMDKLIDCGMVTFSRAGKFKYYFLTDTGQAYYNDHKESLISHQSIGYLIEQLLLIASQDNDTNSSEIIMKIIKAMNEGKYKSHNYKPPTQTGINIFNILSSIIEESAPFKIHIDSNVFQVDNASKIYLLVNKNEKNIYLSDVTQIRKKSINNYKVINEEE